MTSMPTIEQIKSWSLFIERETQKFPELLNPSLWQNAYQDNELLDKLTLSLTNATDLAELNQKIRSFRRAEMVRIALRDLAGLAELAETMRDCSDLAQGLIAGALAWHTRVMEQKYGIPIGKDSNQPQKMLVIGMGKLGGTELNFSSDIDLIFAYPEKGNTEGQTKSIGNDQFFIRLGQALNKSLSEFTADGPAFRVDMRLRPFGDSGPLAVSFSELEHYYEMHGRAWERYALVKAKLMAGDPQQGQELFDILRPFVYRKYIDFTAIESLRELKAMIHAEVVRKDKLHNIKLGPGGIREVEFIVQAFQLIYGGRDKPLQGRRLMPMLELLTQRNLLTAEQAEHLLAAYTFLRHTENRLQEWNDQQTHELPAEPEQQLMLAQAMGFESYAQFHAELAQHQTRVQHNFERVFAEAPQSSEGEAVAIDLSQSIILSTHVDLSHISEFNTHDAETLTQLLNQFIQDRAYQTASTEAISRFKAILPKLLKKASQFENAVETTENALKVLANVMRRSVYFVLLKENPQAIQNLLTVCSLSAWMVEMLVKYPALMDQLLDSQSLFKPLLADELKKEAREILNNTNGDDESFMNEIRQWKHAQVFRVAAADATGNVPLMKVSDYLTWIAEATLDVVVRYAWQFMVNRSGLPAGLTQNDACPFMVIGYGKLGGIELGYGSDLDVVFLYHGLNASDKSQGDKPLEHGVYFLRMSQKIITLMTTFMPTGTLYEVDTRLRPNGASGMMVVDFEAYKTYISNKAWVWEHQALVRARTIVASDAAQNSFDEFKKQTVTTQRDLNTLRQEVVAMRQKMRDSLDQSTASLFDIKQGRGGIVDIEFMVQYFVLGYAKSHPGLAKWSDNIRLLEEIKQAGLLNAEDECTLEDAYREYRKQYHLFALQNQKALVPQTQFAETQQKVATLWQKVMQDNDTKDNN